MSIGKERATTYNLFEVRSLPPNLRRKNIKSIFVSYQEAEGILPEWLCEFHDLESIKIFCEESDTVNLENLLPLKNRISSISIFGERLVEIPNELAEFTKLESLRVHLKCGEFTPPKMLYNLPNLKRLTMCRVKIDDIPDEWYSCKNLEVLELFGCGINEISPNISKLQKLEKLDLRECNLDDIPCEIALCKSLKLVETEGNPLTEFEGPDKERPLEFLKERMKSMPRVKSADKS